MYFANLADVMAHATSGTVRLLAVTGERRAKQLPDVPTLAEAGYPGLTFLSWNGLMAPSGTPQQIVDRIAREIAAAVEDREFSNRLAEIGVDGLGNTPEGFATAIAADIAFWGEAVRSAGLQAK